eukprot:5687524-Alexandrium_andersonii.AAC.1
MPTPRTQGVRQGALHGWSLTRGLLNSGDGQDDQRAKLGDVAACLTQPMVYNWQWPMYAPVLQLTTDRA